MQDIYEMGPQMILGLFAPYNDQEKVVKEFGDKLIFIGPVNSQLITIPETSTEEIIEETIRCLDVFGPSHSIIFDAGTFVPEKLQPMLGTFYQYRGRFYPESKQAS